MLWGEKSPISKHVQLEHPHLGKGFGLAKGSFKGKWFRERFEKRGKEVGVDVLDGPGPAARKTYAACRLGLFDIAASILPAGFAATASLIRQHEQSSRERRAARLESLFLEAEEGALQDIVLSMGFHGPKLGARAVRKVLARKPSRVTYSALDVIEVLGIGGWVDSLERLMERATGQEAVEAPLRIRAARMLLGHFSPENIPTKTLECIITALKRPAPRFANDAGPLLFLFDREAGLKLLEAGLSSSVPHTRTGSAANLAYLGTPESLAILETHPSHEAQTAYAQIRKLPLAEVVPLGKKVELFGRTIRTYSADEMAAARMSYSMSYELEQAVLHLEPLLRRWLPCG